MTLRNKFTGRRGMRCKPNSLKLLFGMLMISAIFHLPAFGQKPDLPEVSGPIPETDSSHAFLSAEHQQIPINLQDYGYIEEEYLVSGEAGVYGWPGESKPEPLAFAPYVTRILVRRPIDNEKFNGIAIVEAFNPSTPVDLPVMWAQSHLQFMADGVAWVGITVKPNTIKALQRFDPQRYAQLKMAHAQTGPSCDRKDMNRWVMSDTTTTNNETGLAWDMLTQTGLLLKSGHADNPLPRSAKWIYLTGQSQTAGYARTYATFFAGPIKEMLGKPLYDGYLYAGAPPWHVPLYQCIAPFPVEDRRILTGAAGVPVIEFFAQGDMTENILNRRPDSDKSPDLYRRYEIAGAAHMDVWEYASFAGDADYIRAVGSTAPRSDPGCYPKDVEETDFPIRYQFNAGWRILHDWVTRGIPAPRAQRLALKEDAANNFNPVSSFLVDEHGNALGGIRSPYVDVPTARWIGSKENKDSWNCMFEGYKIPFEKSKLAGLYQNHEAYVKKVEESVRRLKAQRWLTPEDCTEIIKQAREAALP